MEVLCIGSLAVIMRAAVAQASVGDRACRHQGDCCFPPAACSIKQAAYILLSRCLTCSAATAQDGVRHALSLAEALNMRARGSLLWECQGLGVMKSLQCTARCFGCLA